MDPGRINPELLEPRVRHLVSTDPAHDWHHVVRVFNLGMRIFNQLGAEAAVAPRPAGDAQPDAFHLWGGWPAPTPDDEAALRAALVCHDLGKKADGGPNALVVENDLRPVLAGLGLSEAAFAVALDAINSHSWRRDLRPSSLAAAVVQDADRLDAIGAVGVARCFAFGGYRGRPIHDPDGTADGSLAHFDDKLLKIRDRLNLGVSKALAEERHQFLVEFEARFLAEFEGNC
jgi:uncharacterized protein